MPAARCGDALQFEIPIVQLRLVRIALIFTAACGLAASALAQARVIKKAIQVRSLSVSEAEQGIPVDLRGVVVFIEGASAVFVQDESSTTFFKIDRLPSLRIGDEINVWGKTRMGLYLPGI